MIVALVHPAALKTRALCRRPVNIVAAHEPWLKGLHKRVIVSSFSSPKDLKLVNLSVYLNQLNSSTLPREKKISYVQKTADDVRKNLCRLSVHDPYRLTSWDVESLIDCLVGLHKCDIASPDLGMHALATMACFHDGRKSGPPKYFRNSVRWLQRKELGYSISLLPTDIQSLVPNVSLLRLLWAASLMLGPDSTSQEAGEGAQQVPGGSLPHSWADHEVTAATAKLAADVLVSHLMRQAQIEDKLGQDSKPSSKAAKVAAQHLGVTSPKLVGLAFLCHSSARLQSVTHEPLGLISQLLFCINSSIDNRVDQILSIQDGCNELELDELAKLSNLMAKAADKVV